MLCLLNVTISALMLAASCVYPADYSVAFVGITLSAYLLISAAIGLHRAAIIHQIDSELTNRLKVEHTAMDTVFNRQHDAAEIRKLLSIIINSIAPAPLRLGFCNDALPAMSPLWLAFVQRGDFSMSAAQLADSRSGLYDSHRSGTSMSLHSSS